MIKGALFGLIGGIIGAAIWVMIGVATNSEIGIIAWGIGGLVGLAVGLGTPEAEESALTGVIALVIAMMAIVAGKYFTVSTIIDRELSKMANIETMTDEDLKIGLAWQAVGDAEAIGEVVDWPGGVEPDEAMDIAVFPVSIRKVALDAYDDMTDVDKETAKKEMVETQLMMISQLKDGIKKEAFMASFGVFDILWFLLAMSTAYKLGAGMLDDG